MSHQNRAFAVALVLLTAVACAAGVQLVRDKIQDPGQLLFNGYTNPKVNCFNCHGGDARGSGRGPDLSTKVPKLELAAILSTIENGATFMPAFKEKTSPEEREQIAHWLATTFGAVTAAAATPVEPEPVSDAPATKP